MNQVPSLVKLPRVGFKPRGISRRTLESRARRAAQVASPLPDVRMPFPGRTGTPFRFDEGGTVNVDWASDPVQDAQGTAYADQGYQEPEVIPWEADTQPVQDASAEAYAEPVANPEAVADSFVAWDAEPVQEAQGQAVGATGYDEPEVIPWEGDNSFVPWTSEPVQDASAEAYAAQGYAEPSLGVGHIQDEEPFGLYYEGAHLGRIPTEGQWQVSSAGRSAEEWKPSLSPDFQINAAADTFAKMGLPPELAFLATVNTTMETPNAWRDISLNPTQGFPDQWQTMTAAHEALHAFEARLLPSELAYLNQLIAQYPPPPGYPTSHHPPGQGTSGITAYFDYLLGMFTPLGGQGERKPSIPTDIMQFIRETVPSIVEREGLRSEEPQERREELIPGISYVWFPEGQSAYVVTGTNAIIPPGQAQARIAAYQGQIAAGEAGLQMPYSDQPSVAQQEVQARFDQPLGDALTIQEIATYNQIADVRDNLQQRMDEGLITPEQANQLLSQAVSVITGQTADAERDLMRAESERDTGVEYPNLRAQMQAEGIGGSLTLAPLFSRSPFIEDVFGTAGQAAGTVLGALGRNPGLGGKVGRAVGEAVAPASFGEAGLEFMGIPGISGVRGLKSFAQQYADEGAAAAVKGVFGAGARAVDQEMPRLGRMVDVPESLTPLAPDYLPTAPNVIQAPPAGYHGTSTKFAEFDVKRSEDTSLFGPGIYLTDSLSIAQDYGRFGIEPQARLVEIAPERLLLNLEQPFPLNVVESLNEIAANARNQNQWDALAWSKAADSANRDALGRQVYNSFKVGIAETGVSTAKAGEAFWSFNNNLHDLGYSGLAHTGGVRSGAPHNVTILFDPADARLAGPAQAASAAFQPAASANRIVTQAPPGYADETAGLTSAFRGGGADAPVPLVARITSQPSAYDKMVTLGEAHLDNRDFLRIAGEALEDVPVVGAGMRAVNPSLADEPVRRVHFEYKNLEGIHGAERDSFMAQIPEAPARFKAGDDGMITVELQGWGPVRVAFGDVATRPNDYVLTQPELDWINNNWQLIDSFKARVDGIAAQAQAGGVPVRDIQPLVFASGEHYWPRFVVDDGRLNVGGRIGKQQGIEQARLFDDMTVGIQKGVDYVHDPKKQLDLYIASMQKRERDIAYQMRLEDLKIGKHPAGGLKGDEPGLGRIFSAEESRLIAQQTGVEPTALKVANIPSAISRLLVTGIGDAGTLTLQIATTLDHPLIFTESAVRGLLNVLSDQEGALLRSAKGQAAAHYGALGGKNEYFEYAGGRSLLGKGYDVISAPARAVFDGSINAARVLLFDALAAVARADPDYFLNPKALEEELYRIGRFVQTMTGGTNTQTLGVSATQQGVERLLAFAPRYSRSGVALAAHALHGGVTGAEAKKAILTFVLGGMAITGGIAYYKSDGDWNAVKDAWNPAKNFMGWQDGANNVGIGGIIRALIKLGGSIYDDPGGLIQLDFKDNPLLKFARSRSSPLVGSIIDFATGKDFFGRDVPGDFKGIMTYLASRNLVPFAIGAAGEAKGDLSDKLKAAGLSALGLRTSPVPGWVLEGQGQEKTLGNLEILRTIFPERIANLIKNEKYNDLPTPERRALDPSLDPKLKETADAEERKKGSDYQKSEDEKDAIRRSFVPIFDALAAKLETATPQQAGIIRDAIRLAEQDMGKRIAAVKYPGEFDPLGQSQAERLYNGYNSLYDKAGGDRALLAQLQAQYIAGIVKANPDAGARLIWDIQQVNPLQHPTSQALDRLQPAVSAYNSLPTYEEDFGKARTAWQIENPKANADLYAYAYNTELRTLEAVKIFQQEHPGRPIVVDLYFGFGPREPGHPKPPPGNEIYTQDWRRAHPAQEAEYFQWGWFDELKSLEAYNIVFGGH